LARQLFRVWEWIQLALCQKMGGEGAWFDKLEKPNRLKDRILKAGGSVNAKNQRFDGFVFGPRFVGVSQLLIRYR